MAQNSYSSTCDDEAALNLHKEDFTVFACLGDLLHELEQRGYPAGERQIVPELCETASILSQVHELGQLKAVNSQAAPVAHPEREIFTELEKLADICHPNEPAVNPRFSIKDVHAKDFVPETHLSSAKWKPEGVIWPPSDKRPDWFSFSSVCELSGERVASLGEQATISEAELADSSAKHKISISKKQSHLLYKVSLKLRHHPLSYSAFGFAFNKGLFTFIAFTRNDVLLYETRQCFTALRSFHEVLEGIHFLRCNAETLYPISHATLRNNFHRSASNSAALLDPTQLVMPNIVQYRTFGRSSAIYKPGNNRAIKAVWLPQSQSYREGRRHDKAKEIEVMQYVRERIEPEYKNRIPELFGYADWRAVDVRMVEGSADGTVRDDRRHLWLIEMEEGSPVVCGSLKTGKELACFLLDSSKTLDAIHATGVVHRDLSRGNLMMRKDACRAFVIDYGNARHFNVESGTYGETDDPLDTRQKCSLTMTRDAVPFAVFTFGRDWRYQFHVRQEKESLSYVLLHVVGITLVAQESAAKKKQTSRSTTRLEQLSWTRTESASSISESGPVTRSRSSKQSSYACAASSFQMDSVVEGLPASFSAPVGGPSTSLPESETSKKPNSRDTSSIQQTDIFNTSTKIQTQELLLADGLKTGSENWSNFKILRLQLEKIQSLRLQPNLASGVKDARVTGGFCDCLKWWGSRSCRVIPGEEERDVWENWAGYEGCLIRRKPPSTDEAATQMQSLQQNDNGILVAQANHGYTKSNAELNDKLDELARKLAQISTDESLA